MKYIVGFLVGVVAAIAFSAAADHVQTQRRFDSVADRLSGLEHRVTALEKANK